MDLRDRRRRERLRVDHGEVLEADVALDHRPDALERHGRDVVDELAELVDVDVGEQVGPRREQLAQLDVRRAELLERLPELDRSLARRRPVADDADLSEDAQQP